MPHVYSTLSCDQNYAFYGRGGGDMPVKSHYIHIKGGTGIANDRIVTPLGAVVTEITDEEAEQLRSHPVFQRHEKNGFIRIDDKKVDGERAAASMETADGSAPLTPASYPESAEGDVEATKVRINDATSSGGRGRRSGG